MTKFAGLATAVVIVFAIAFGWACLLAWMFQFLWNFALVSTFGAPVLSFWVSFAIVVLLQFVAGMFIKRK